MASKLQLPRGPNSSNLPNYLDSSSLQGSPSPALLALQTKPATSLVLRTKAAALPAPHQAQGSGRPMVLLLCSAGQERARTVRAQESRVGR